MALGLAKISQQLIGKQYSLGKTDCFATAYDYMLQIGIELPGEWHGLSLETYADLYEKNPEYAKQVMIEFLDEYLEPIEPNKAFAGDILLCTLRGFNHYAPAIHGGNGNIIVATEDRGVTIMPLKYYSIRKVWRCHK